MLESNREGGNSQSLFISLIGEEPHGIVPDVCPPHRQVLIIYEDGVGGCVWVSHVLIDLLGGEGGETWEDILEG